MLNRIDRKTAAPSVPPIDRKNVTDEVDTPISRGEAAFCTARIIGCMLPPRPRPISTMTSIVCHSGVSAPTREKQHQRDQHQRAADDREDPVPAGPGDQLAGR